MSPQPRPRSKRPRTEDGDWGDDEVLTPEVLGEGELDDGLPPARPDRRPLYALIAGISAVWFAVLSSILAFLIAPLAIGLGLSAMRRIDRGDGDPRERRKAKIGFVAGVISAGFLVLQVVLFAVFFQWDKTDDDFEVVTEKVTVTTEAPTETTEPDDDDPTGTTVAPPATTAGPTDTTLG